MKENENATGTVKLLYLEKKRTYKSEYHHYEATILSPPNKGGYVTVQLTNGTTLPWRNGHWEKSTRSNITKRKPSSTADDITARLGSLSLEDERYYVYMAIDCHFIQQKCLNSDTAPSLDEFVESLLYVGKGVNDRMTDHSVLACNLDDNKLFYKRIRSLWKEERSVYFWKVMEGLNEDYAFDIESVLIQLKACCPDDAISTDTNNRKYLMNKVKGRRLIGELKEVEKLLKIMKTLAYSSFLSQLDHIIRMQFKPVELCHKGKRVKRSTEKRKPQNTLQYTRDEHKIGDLISFISKKENMDREISLADEEQVALVPGPDEQVEVSVIETNSEELDEDGSDNESVCSICERSTQDHASDHCPVCRQRQYSPSTGVCCADCNTKTCETHAEACTVCSNISCHKCLRICTICDKLVCQSDFSEEDEACFICLE